MPLIKIPKKGNPEATVPQISNNSARQDIKNVSSVQICLRTSKTSDNPFGFLHVENIPYDEPCVLYIGGDGAQTDKAANGYAKIIESDILKPMGIKIPIYTIKYDFADNKTWLERRIAFMKNRTDPRGDLNSNIGQERKANINRAYATDAHPQYIDTLYKKILEPRISQSNGTNKLDIKEACRRIRNLTIVAHCHGGYVVLELEKKMRQEMNRLGYKSGEQKQILSQMLTVAHAPACALGVAKSQMISFMTINDIEWPKSINSRLANNFFNNYLFNRKRENIRHHNAILNGDEKQAAENRALDMPPCYFAPQQGNMFLIKEKRQRAPSEDMCIVNNEEHNEIGYTCAGKTPNGILMTLIAKNIIQNGIINSLQQKNGFTPLPDLENLIQDENPEHNTQLKILFAKMRENGIALRKKIYSYALAERRADSKSI